jgi:hypothetical protein
MGVTPLDKRADVYSLTAVTYAMLTGHPTFQVRSIADIPARDPLRTPAMIATCSESKSYYVLRRVSALALFAISMFLTILVFR